MRGRAWCLAVVASAACSVLPGCGGSVVRPEMAQVQGSVTYRGKKIDKGLVTYTPVNSSGVSGGTNALGPIESDGSYSLTTFNTGDGAILGQHVVTVSVPSQDIRELNKPKADGSIAYILPKSAIPARYSDSTKSPLRQTVVVGKNVFDLELKD